MVNQACNHCQRRFNIPEKYVGQVIKCPICRNKIRVLQNGIIHRPVLSKNSDGDKPTATHQQDTAKTEPNAGIKFSLPWFDPIVAFGMIVVALSYIALIIAIFTATIVHAAVNYKNILAIGEDASFLVFLIYVGIIVLGFGFTFFLLKPVLAKNQKSFGKVVSRETGTRSFRYAMRSCEFFSN